MIERLTVQRFPVGEPAAARPEAARPAGRPPSPDDPDDPDDPGDVNQPPVGSTGGTLTGIELAAGLTLKLDWCNAVAMGGEASVELLDALAARYWGPGEEMKRAKHSYTAGREYEHGACLMWSPGRADVMLSANGDAMDVVGPSRYRAFLGDLYAAGVHLTRLDVAADDVARSVPLELVKQARDAGNVVGPRVSRVIESHQRCGGQQVSTGVTVEFGKRGKEGSGKFLRVYDKELESGGAEPGIRWEVVFSKEWAEVAGQHLSDADDDAELARMMGRLLAGSIDFRDRDGGRVVHVKRMARLDWWEALVRRLGSGLRLVVPRVVPPLQKAIAQMRKQYGRSLALARVVCDSVGVSFADLMGRMLDDCERRIDWRRASQRNLAIDPRVAFG